MEFNTKSPLETKFDKKFLSLNGKYFDLSKRRASVTGTVTDRWRTAIINHGVPQFSMLYGDALINFHIHMDAHGLYGLGDSASRMAELNSGKDHGLLSTI
jgi:hypothetical protein